MSESPIPSFANSTDANSIISDSDSTEAQSEYFYVPLVKISVASLFVVIISPYSTIREKFEETASIFGFKMVDPSPIESLSTLEAKSGPEIRKEIYNFKDKADREIALRFDFTVGTTRHVASKQFERMPAKFSSFGGVWRYDEPQKGTLPIFSPVERRSIRTAFS